ncbi:MAG: type III pantothenate kinase [Chitinophagales bacterium]|nr:type III pantothenate kinase [Chitinophagales bacterium]
MHLILDVGNTATKYAVFKNSDLIAHGIVESDSSIAQLPYGFKACLIGASGNIPPSLTHELDQLNIPYARFNHQMPIPIINAYETPQTLGPDRLAAVIGAAEEFPKSDILVINAGTCITYDLITSEGKYCGGAISPGLRMRFRAMSEFTAHLPLIEDIQGENPLLGRNTNACLKSGTIHGIAAEIEGFIDRFKLNYPNLRPILTGGDAEFLECQMKIEIFVSKFLVLKGLNAVLIHNEV